MNVKLSKWMFHIVSLVFGAVVFGLLIYNISQDWRIIVDKIQPAPFWGSFFASLVITGSVSVRWGLIVNALGKEKITSWFQFFYLFSMSRALGQVLPKDLTDISIRSIGLKKGHNFSYTLGGVSVFFDRMLDLLTIAFLIPPTILYWTDFVSWQMAIYLMVLSLAILGILLIYTNNYLFKILVKIVLLTFNKLRQKKFFRKKLPSDFVIPEIGRNDIVKIYSVSLLKVVANISRFVLFAFVFNLAIEPHTIILGTPLAQFVYIFAFTPSGLGIFEAGWMGVLTIAHIGREEALVFVIGQRILSALFITIFAGVSQLIWTMNYLFKRYKVPLSMKVPK